jgi:hypothetical protein
MYGARRAAAPLSGSLNRLVPVIAFSARQRCLKLVTLRQHAVQIVLPLVHHHLFKVHV